jgi:protein transport protein SEC23
MPKLQSFMTVSIFCSYSVGIAARAANNGHSIDIFAGCLDQVGLAEMKQMVNSTTGFMILSDSFQTTVFKKSFQRIFDKDSAGNLLMGFNATLDVSASREFRINGLIGPAVSVQRKNASVAETEIGIGGTSAWKFCSITPKTTTAIFFEVAKQTQPQIGTNGIIQFVTHYQHSSGFLRLRVTTISRPWVDSNDPVIPREFDQECAAAVMAR